MLSSPRRKAVHMAKSMDTDLEAEDAIHGLVRERTRNRLFVMLAIFAAFAGFIVATSLMYMNP